MKKNHKKICKLNLYYDYETQNFSMVSNIPEENTIVSTGRTLEEILDNFNIDWKHILYDKVEEKEEE